MRRSIVLSLSFQLVFPGWPIKRSNERNEGRKRKYKERREVEKKERRKVEKERKERGRK
jgi:hypothetical protein